MEGDEQIDYDFFEEPVGVTDTGIDQSISASNVYTIRLEGSKDIILRREPMAGTGGLVWPAGELLARKLCRMQEQLRDKTILELGSGTGIVGLSVCTNMDLGKGTLYLTDLEKVLASMRHNVELNGSPANLQIRALSWGDEVSEELLSPDIVLMADCIYLEALFEPLIDTLLQVIGPATIAYLCYKKRRRADARFFKMLRKHFTYKEDIASIGMSNVKDIHLYEVRLKLPSTSL